MSRKTLVALAVCALAMACDGALGVVSATGGFENGMKPWTVNNEGGSALSATVVRVNAPVRTGEWAVEMTASGRPGKGAVWLLTKNAVAPGTYIVELSFWAWEQTGRPNWDVVGLLGTTEPQKQRDFRVLGPGIGDTEWKRYEMATSASVRAGEVIWVALGGATLAHVDADLVFDDVKVSITQTACAADFDHSGAATVGDVFAFLNAWFAGSPLADADGSGRLTTADVFEFVNDWFIGC